jgi:hypothetical protein
MVPPHASGFNNALAIRQRDRWGAIPLPVATEIVTSVVPAEDTAIPSVGSTRLTICEAWD